jgi:hypothetical protein
VRVEPRSLARLLDAARRDRADLSVADFDAEQVRWAVTAGLGPWLRRCTVQDPSTSNSPLWPLVQGADLTARIIAAEIVDAMEEIIDVAERHLPPLTLLKGISLCEQYYPEPHLRTMGDIDILVDDDALSALRARLIELGYRPQSHYPPEFYETHHHATPLFHPRRRVWVEVHRGLFPPSSCVGSDEVFGRERVRAELQPSLFRGRSVNRLGDELQLVYLASHWAFGFTRERAMVGLLDVIRLLDQASLRWERILPWLEGSFASTYVYLLLTYLARRGLADLDPSILEGLRRRQRSFGRANLAALHAVIDRHVVEGRPFDRVVSERTFGILWQTLLSPGRSSRNMLRLGWRLLPSRAWLTRALTDRA